MAASDRRAWIAGCALLHAACTFGGLGNYEVESCTAPVGTSSPVLEVGMVTDLTFSNDSGADVIAAFATPATTGNCIEAVNPSGFLGTGCAFLGDQLTLVPRQPMVVTVPSGHATAFVATTAPCTAGAIGYRANANSVSGGADLACAASGAALPALATVASSSASTTFLAWYGTSVASRSEPINGCAAATPAPLELVAIADATSASPVAGTPVTLDASSVSVRPPAMVSLADGKTVLVASPVVAGVSLWAVTASALSPIPITIPGLAGARAVEMAVASDGSGRIAIAAEIGCAPQSIAFTTGTLADGFTSIAVAAPANGDLAIAPSVAWIDDPGRTPGRWLLTWISNSGGAHVVARSYDATGKALDVAFDANAPATSAAVSSSANVLWLAAADNSFTQTSLGCSQ